jgi:hypothetical protein
MEESYPTPYPIDLGDGWTFECLIRRNSSGQFVITEMKLKAVSPKALDEGMTSSLLRALSVSRLDDLAEQTFVDMNQSLLINSRDIWSQYQKEKWLEEVSGEWKLRGRSGHDISLYAKTAFFFVEAMSKSRKSPMVSLAEKLEIPKETLSGRIKQARKLNLLTSPKKSGDSPSGRAGGELTAKCIEILNSSEAAG